MNIEEKFQQLLAEESTQPERYIYLSFAQGKLFLGGVITKAKGFMHAIAKTKKLQINPGGEVAGLPIPEDEVPDAKYLDRLLTKEELNEFWEMGPIPEAKTKEMIQ
jgi:hypothetical protein